jgi:hypothetical protein
VPRSEERVLIRVLPRDRRVAARLRAELEVIGFEAEDLDISEDAPPLGPDLLDELDAAGASAGIEIVLGNERIDVWVADGNTGKTLNRRFDLDGESARVETRRTLALAAVELLRASRLEIGQAPGMSNQATAQATEDEQAPFDERPRFHGFPLRGALSLAPMLGGSPGKLGLTTHLEVAGRWVPPTLPRFALRFSLWIPTLGNRVTGEQGQARVFTTLAFIEPQLRLPGGATWFHPELGLGLGGALVVSQGLANSTFVSSDAILGGFAGYGHLGLAFELSPRVWLRLDGYLGIVQPQPRIFFVDELVAQWGLPFGSGSLGVELWF